MNAMLDLLVRVDCRIVKAKKWQLTSGSRYVDLGFHLLF